MASKNKSLITSFALTALVGICASLAACEIVDELPDDGDGDMGGENGDADGGAGGESSTGGAAATGGQATGGTTPMSPTCDYAESCADESILAACNAILANYREEITDIAVPCMNEGSCEESVTSEDCLAIAYEQADLSDYDTDYCDPGISDTCEWDSEDFADCDKKIMGIQTAAQEDFEDCIVSDAGMCDPTLCTEILR